MEENKLAIKICGVRKQYTLGTIGGRTLQKDLQSWWAKKRGREDPNIIIGTDTRLIGQKFWALNGIDLEINQGERIGIIGANGAGKSTLLKLLSRVTAPTEGDIYIWGRVSSLLEVGTGFHGELTGRENVYMNGTILGMNRAAIDARMDEIIEFSEVGEFIDTPVKRYSSGMFVRLAFAVAAHLNSEIMIMDEVLAVGDVAFQNKCLERMHKAADDEGKTILYVSHNMATIRQLCDRCIVMDQGKIIFDGESEEAIARYMNLGIQENAVDIDLTGRSTMRPGLPMILELTHVTLLGKTFPTYEQGEDMNLRLRFSVANAISDVIFRITLSTDTNTPLGTSWTPIMNFKEAGMYEMDVRMPMAYVARGIFYVNISIGRMLYHGGNHIVSSVDRVFKIEVTGKSFWKISGRGYFKLPDSVVENISRLDEPTSGTLA